MRGPFQKRWILILTMSVWAVAATLQGAAPLLSASALSVLRPSEKSPVEASAIRMGAGHRLATCAHHPRGCPPSCLCPKTGFTDGDGASAAVSASVGHDRLTAAAWVECSETRAAAAPAFAVYLPGSPDWILVTIPETSWAPAAPAPARAPALAPPAKIPIG